MEALLGMPVQLLIDQLITWHQHFGMWICSRRPAEGQIENQNEEEWGF